jgi:hypothetical protein
VTQQPFTAADLNQLRADYVNRRRRSLTRGSADASQLITAFANRHGVAVEEVWLALLDRE